LPARAADGMQRYTRTMNNEHRMSVRLNIACSLRTQEQIRRAVSQHEGGYFAARIALRSFSSDSGPQ
jgi:hypothetical protein